jgi:hypothetical protein
VIDVAVFAVDSPATVLDAIRSGQADPAIPPLFLPCRPGVAGIAGSTKCPTACC